MRNFFMKASIGMGVAIGLWSAVAFVSALAYSDWQVSEVLRQYLIAIGVLKEFNTLVDFTTHIKGIEYLICVAFLGLFPAFYRYVNRPPIHGDRATA